MEKMKGDASHTCFASCLLSPIFAISLRCFMIWASRSYSLLILFLYPMLRFRQTFNELMFAQSFAAIINHSITIPINWFKRKDVAFIWHRITGVKIIIASWIILYDFWIKSLRPWLLPARHILILLSIYSPIFLSRFKTYTHYPIQNLLVVVLC